MWHFSMQGLPPADVTIIRCELLPHIFIFSTCKNKGSYFLWHFLLPPETGSTRLLTGALLCAVRTFLPTNGGSITRFAAIFFKDAITKIKHPCRFHELKSEALMRVHSHTSMPGCRNKGLLSQGELNAFIRSRFRDFGKRITMSISKRTGLYRH